MIRFVLAVLSLPVLGGLFIWLALQSPGGAYVEAAVVTVGILAVIGIAEAIAKGQSP